MKKILIILILTIIGTAIGLYFRPSYTLVGQLNWEDVLTKGYFVGSVAGFFTQGLINESFWFVMRFTGAALLLGIIGVMFLGKGKPAAKKKK